MSALSGSKRGQRSGRPLLARTAVVFASEHELYELTGEGDRARAAEVLLDLGAGVVVCKLGARGIHTIWRGGDHHLRAEPVVPQGDSVGAGDVAAAGYIAGMLEGLTPDGCTALAHECAVASLAGLGRATYPDRAFLDLTMERLRD